MSLQPTESDQPKSNLCHNLCEIEHQINHMVQGQDLNPASRHTETHKAVTAGARAPPTPTSDERQGSVSLWLERRRHRGSN